MNIRETQLAYKEFRKKYGPLLRAAKREMNTPLQKALVDRIAATAYSAGYNTPGKPATPVKLKGWKAQTKGNTI